MKKIFTRLFLLSLTFCYSSFLPAYGQLEIIWDKSYGGRGGERLSNAISLSDGQVLLYGSSGSTISGNKTAPLRGNYDYWLMMMDEDGNKLWDRSYGGDDYDLLTSVVPMPDGGFLLGGYSRSEASGDKTEGRRGEREFDTDMWVIKVDAAGNKVWDKTYGGNRDDYLYAATATDDGGFLLLGVSQSGISFEKTAAPRGSYDFWLVKIDTAGNKLWDKAYGGSGRDSDAHSLLKVGDHYLLGGSSYSEVSGEKTAPSRGDADYWLVMVDGEGEKLWDKTYGGSESDRFNTMIAVEGGGYLLGGSSVSDASGDKSENSRGATDLWVIRLDEEGNMLWDRTYGGDGGEGVSDIWKTPEGDFLLGAGSNSNVSGEKTEGSRGPYAFNDFWLLKIEESGDKLWDKTIGGNQHDGMAAMVPVAEGLLLAGSSSSEISGDRTAVHYGSDDFWVLNVVLEEEDGGPKDPANALSGTFTIGGDSPDFESFSMAIAALEEKGVKGQVTFKVRPGTYEESLEINHIPGSSCSNAILFEGEGAAPAQVIIQSPADSLATLRIHGADGIGFRNVSIVRDVEIWPGSDCFSLENNLLAASVHARSFNISRNNQHLYRNNIFQSGKITIENQSPWNPEAPVFDQGLVIEGNEFRHTGPAISVSNQQGFTISRNMIRNLTSGGTGIAITNSWYGHEISGNTISGAASRGMNLNSVSAAKITENQISFQDGGTGMEITTGKSLGNEILIANNLVIVDGYDARGIYYFPIDNLVGMKIHNPQAERVELYHNTFYVSGYSDYVPNYALFITGKNRSYHVFNNIIVNFAGGKDIIVRDNQAVAAMDYNNFTAYLPAIWGIQEISSLAEWQRITGYDEHSVAAHPGSPVSPNEAITGAGIYLTEVPKDVFDQERNNPPTIGAVEKKIIPLPISGTFTIGGENPDFAGFSEAIAALEDFVVTDSVLFKVRPGVYYEQLNIIAAIKPDASVIFEGESGDSTEVILRYPLGEVMVLKESQNFTFRYLTFASGIKLEKLNSILFESNVMEGGLTGFTVSGDTYRNNLFLNRGIYKSGQGLVDEGPFNSFYTDHHLIIQGNTFKGREAGVFLSAQSDVNITDNKFIIEGEEAPSGPTAIYINSSEKINEIKGNSVISGLPNTIAVSLNGGPFTGEFPKEITQNQILLRKGGTGLHIDYAGATFGSGLIANNIISVNALYGSTGISISYVPGNIDIFHNSVYLYGEGPESRIMYFGDEIMHEVNLKNNLLANQAGGMVFEGDYFQYSPQKIASSDYNNLFTKGPVFAQWKEGAVPDLAAWQALTGFDLHSLSVDPQFESAEMPVPANPALDGAGIYLAGVPFDFFGQLRNNPPDIGAVKFEPLPEKPRPTPGFAVGGAVFHSPAGAISPDPLAGGRAILSFYADQKKGEERPKGVASLTIPQADFRFQSVYAYEWMSVDDNKAILEGTGTLNREEGYRFIISVEDRGTGSHEPKDTYRMIILNPEGEVVYDNQRGLETYATATMPVERGNIIVGKELVPNARHSSSPPTAPITAFKAYPTQLDQEGLWLEIPAQEGANKLQLSIVDRQGRLMTTSTLQAAGKQQLKLNTQGWSPGIYILILRGEGIHYQQKLLK